MTEIDVILPPATFPLEPVTVRSEFAVIPPNSAVMTVLPPTTPVAKPEELMVATATLFALQATELVTSWLVGSEEPI
jgi:hypothetical protein